MNDRNLGRLERVEDLRNTWPTEDQDFTPWLAQPENLKVLGNTLGLELETEAEEKNIGRYRADILCRETGSDDWVLIENQLEGTNHTHLGQLLTYAAGLRAVTVVWIAKSFTDEHRAALDWLNEATDERLRFFGIEIELWKIEESPLAPKFNVVSKPNDWSREVAREARDAPLSETQKKLMAYWAALNKTLDEAGGRIRGNRTPQPHTVMLYDIRGDFRLRARIVPTQKLISTELVIERRHAEVYFERLKQQREEIEREFGFPLDWREQTDREKARIEYPLEGVDPFNDNDWPRQHEWFADRLNAMHRALSQPIRNLDLEDLPNDEDE